MKKQLKIAAFAVLLAVGYTANSQITDAANTNLEKNKGRKAGGTADDEKSIRLIDNKGTIKYIQAKNGLTQITSTKSGNQTVTTWQLGGALNANTYIKAGSTKEFALDGLELVGSPLTKAEFDAAVIANSNFNTDANKARIISTDATDRSSHGTGTGFTVLIRDEESGALKKIKLSDLLQVQADHEDIKVTTAQVTSLFTPAGGISLAFKYPNIIEASYSKVSVYRNGAKLRANFDYNLDNTGTTTKVVLIDKSSANEPDDWTLYEGDQIEIHALK